MLWPLPFSGVVVVVDRGAEFTAEAAVDFLIRPGALDLLPLGLGVVTTGGFVAPGLGPPVGGFLTGFAAGFVAGFLPGFPAAGFAFGRVEGLAVPAPERGANVRAAPRRGPSPIARTGLLLAGLRRGLLVGLVRTAT